MTEPTNKEGVQAPFEGAQRTVRSTIPQGNSPREQEPARKKSVFEKFRKAESKVLGTVNALFGASSAHKTTTSGTGVDPSQSDAVKAAKNFNDKSLEFMFKLIKPISLLAAKGILALSVLTGFAEKKTEAQVDKEPPKATLNVGTLGVTVAKVKINNGDKTTDFDANMPLAKAAREVVGKAFPQSEQDKFFTDNPIEKGVFGEKAKEILAKHSVKKAPVKDTRSQIPAQVLADKLGKDM